MDLEFSIICRFSVLKILAFFVLKFFLILPIAVFELLLVNKCHYRVGLWLQIDGLPPNVRDTSRPPVTNQKESCFFV